MHPRRQITVVCVILKFVNTHAQACDVNNYYRDTEDWWVEPMMLDYTSLAVQHAPSTKQLENSSIPNLDLNH